MKVGYFVGHFPYKDLLNHPESCHYTTRYNHDGGVAAAFDLAMSVADRGHEISVFTTSITCANETEQNGNITVHRYGTTFKFETVNVSLSLLRKPFEHKVDLVHVHSVNPVAELAALRYVRKRRVPLVVTYHGDPQESFGALARRAAVKLYIEFLLDKVLSSADIIVSPSRIFLNSSRFLGKYEGKIVIVPNGIVLRDFTIPYLKEECKQIVGLEGNIILFVGRLDRRKGPEVLVKAFVEVLRDVPRAKLVIVGTGPLRATLARFSKSLGIDDRVRFAGFIEDGYKPFYYRSADVFVLPSVMSSEIFGIVNLEAMASGTPIIASNIGGIPDVVEDGKEGLLVPPNDPSALARAITGLLMNEELRNRMSQQALRKVGRFSWGKIAEKTEMIYKQLIDRSVDTSRSVVDNVCE